MLRRSRGSAFAAGMYVFPGGQVEGDDHLHSYDPWRCGPSAQQMAQVAALGHEWRGFWIAAIRETFEESGLLLARDEQDALLDLQQPEALRRLQVYRQQLHSGETDLLQVCRREGITLACDQVHFLNRWVTPPGQARRFDTRFFIAEVPPAQTGVHDQKETDASLWIAPDTAIRRDEDRQDSFRMMPVTRIQLQTLAQFSLMVDLHQWILERREFPTYRLQSRPGVD